MWHKLQSWAFYRVRVQSDVITPDAAERQRPSTKNQVIISKDINQDAALTTDSSICTLTRDEW